MLLTLGDLYVESISAAPLPVLGVFVLASYSRRLVAPTLYHYSLLIIVTLSVLYAVFHASVEADVYMRTSALIGWTVVCCGSFIDFTEKQSSFLIGIRNALILHITFFLVQFTTYNVTGFYIDVCALWVGCESKYITSASNLYTRYLDFRSTGLFTEPSNYAAHVVVLASVYSLFVRKVTPVVVLALGTAVLSFSSWAVVGVAIACGIIARATLGAGIFITAVFGALFYIFDWFIQRTTLGRYATGLSPLDTRIEGARFILTHTVNSPLGVGAGAGQPVSFYGVWIMDQGAFLSLLYILGILVFLVFGLLLYAARDYREKLFVCLIAIAKVSVVHPFMWIVISLFIQRLGYLGRPQSR